MSSKGSYGILSNDASAGGDFLEDYLGFFAFLFVAACLKTIQRQIRIPYTTVVYILTTVLICSLVMMKGAGERTFKVSTGVVGLVGTQAIRIFVPAFVVHSTQGINSYIFRRCRFEIMVFSIGTFSISAGMAYLYARKIADDTWKTNECIFFGLFLCCVERMPLSDVLFDEGRYPVIATMIQSEALFSTAIMWFLYGLLSDSADVDGSPNQNSPLVFPFQNQVLALLVGALMGGMAMMALRVIPFGSEAAVMVIVCFTYLTYFFLETLGSSGVTGVIAYTMIINTHRFISCTELQDTLEDYWAVLFDVTGTFSTFVAASYTARLLSNYHMGFDFADMFLCYVLKMCIRFVAVSLLYPVIGHFGYRISARQALLLIWMGVKGTYVISLATLYHIVNTDTHTESVAKSFMFIVCDMLLTQAINVSFLPQLLSALGFSDVSEVDCNTMKDAVMYIQEVADNAAAINHNDPYFLLADWRWVRKRTHVVNPLEASFRFQRSRNRSKRDKRKRDKKQSQEHNQIMAVENVLRIESVSFARQHREGSIQKKTLMALVAALQYPYDKKIYLDMDIIASLVDIPKWVLWIKERIAVPTNEDKSVSDDSASLTERIAKPISEKLMDLFEHEYYEMVITNTTLAFVSVLLGFLNAVVLYHEVSLLFLLGIEAVYLIMFFIEVALMVSAYGQKLVNLDYYNRLDLLILATCACVFAGQCVLWVIKEDGIHVWLCVVFILVIAVRLAHAVKYIELVGLWTSSLIHRYLDAVIYSAYEAGHAIVTGEEEVQRYVWKYVDSADLAMDIRSHATVNRLTVLRKLADIHSRFPGIMVAFRSRLASTTILGDLSRRLADMRMDGLLDAEDNKQLRLEVQYQHVRIIGEPCSLPTSYTPIAMLRVIPWIKSDIIRQFLAIKIRPVSFNAGEVIVERGEENPILLTYSGILKIEGQHEESGDGALPNSASHLFYFNEGYFADFVASPACVGELGLVTEEHSITRIIAETQTNAYIIPRERIMEGMRIFTRPPSFLYEIWAYIARNVGLLILQTHPKYQTWPPGRLKRRLETFLMPNLENASRFMLTSDIYDTMLIQGVAIDTETQELLTGPMYIPHWVRRLNLPGVYHHRVRPVLLIIADKRYRLPTEVDWLQPCEGAEDDEGQYQEYLNREFGPQEQPQLFLEDDN
ncbi:uncharacterized protein LOC135386228 [Ornithodoros turicata]|uniref:uncharacterized protein LOC135386228 n=1 Tax=Ornithodoros turicata TaxID=34597 RepID=UPI0031394C3B